MHRTASRILSVAAGAAVATVATLGLAAPASAHVTVATANTVAGSYTVLTFSVPHGCEGQPTTEVAIQIPEPILAVTPTVNPNWEVEKVMTDLAEPVADAHGNEVTERVSEVVYTATTPLPEGYRDAFELSLRLPEETAGQTLYFPVVQTCTEGEHPWIQIAEEGQDPDELDEPAPFIEVTAADESEVEPQDAEPAADTAAGEEESSNAALTYVALAVGALGVLLGAFALVRGRRTS